MVTAESADKIYHAAVARVSVSAYAQLPPGKYLKRKFGDNWYYLVDSHRNRKLRDKSADDWRTLGYSVRVIGQEVYARKV